MARPAATLVKRIVIHHPAGKEAVENAAHRRDQRRTTRAQHGVDHASRKPGARQSAFDGLLHLGELVCDQRLELGAGEPHFHVDFRNVQNGFGRVESRALNSLMAWKTR